MGVFKLTLTCSAGESCSLVMLFSSNQKPGAISAALPFLSSHASRHRCHSLIHSDFPTHLPFFPFLSVNLSIRRISLKPPSSCSSSLPPSLAPHPPILSPSFCVCVCISVLIHSSFHLCFPCKSSAAVYSGPP